MDDQQMNKRKRVANGLTNAGFGLGAGFAGIEITNALASKADKKTKIKIYDVIDKAEARRKTKFKSLQTTHDNLKGVEKAYRDKPSNRGRNIIAAIKDERTAGKDKVRLSRLRGLRDKHKGLAAKRVDVAKAKAVSANKDIINFADKGSKRIDRLHRLLDSNKAAVINKRFQKITRKSPLLALAGGGLLIGGGVVAGVNKRRMKRGLNE